MRNYIKQLALFFIPLLLIAVVVEVAVRKMGENTENFYKDQYIISNSSKIKTLILGSSHTSLGINPKYMPQGAFNAAIKAQPINIDCDLLRGYIDELDSLETVVLSISYFTFRSSPVEEHPQRYLYYTIYMRPEIECSPLCKVATFNGAFIMDRFKERRTTLRCDKLGHVPMQKVSADWDMSVSSAMQNNTRKNGKYVEKSKRNLTQIIQMCKARGVRVVAVTTPCHQMYREQMDKEQYEQMQQIMAQMVDEYNIEYYNYMFDDRFVKDDFVDPDHLRDVGAVKFTKILVEDMASGYPGKIVVK